MFDIEIILQFVRAIMECIQDRKNETESAAANRIQAGLEKPGRREYRGILRMLRREEDLAGSELREEAREVFGMLKEASTIDIESLVTEAVNTLDTEDSQ